MKPSAKYAFLGLAILVFFASPLSITFAQELVTDDHEVVRARVTDVLSSERAEIPGTGTEATIQELRARITEGEREGEEITFENDFLELSDGQAFYLNIITDRDGRVFYSVSEPYRLPALIAFAVLFLAVTIIFGGKQGVRGIVSLGVSVFVIFWFLLPRIIGGGDPVAISLIASSFIIILGSYITHGFTKTTTTAVAGMVTTILATGALALVAVKTAHLSGFSSDEAIYLNFNTGGTLDFQGLLFGGILIGLLGILYDAAISQAVIVEELHHANKLLPKKTVYKKAVRIGREHIGALVDTLAIAYVGASLPLFLFFFSVNQPSLAAVANREIFATELIRIFVGSIGVIMTVPITTWISTLIIVKKPEPGYVPEQEDPEVHHHH